MIGPFKLLCTAHRYLKVPHVKTHCSHVTVWSTWTKNRIEYGI